MIGWALLWPERPLYRRVTSAVFENALVADDRAQKLGYARANHGESWFTDYTKTWRGLAITATIKFSGSSFPEENKPVALLSLKFLRADWDYQESLTLGEVPGLLLSECYQDLRQLAAKGKGFDAEWAKICGA